MKTIDTVKPEGRTRKATLVTDAAAQEPALAASQKMEAHDLFSLFTASIMRKKVLFTR